MLLRKRELNLQKETLLVRRAAVLFIFDSVFIP